ncbi:MAG TPA: TolC family protein [Lacibacter sp.]|nr:TolC family protein [Lacibacter sp.]HMO88187.1 TolC family protein [Lacibacter sp.]HMP86210.1 TolC family protein [Lacibacter sp.]
MKNNAVRSLLLLLVLLGIGSAIPAQQAVHRLSAREAVQKALQNLPELKNLRLDYSIAVARNKEIVGAAYPQISGNVQMNRFLDIPVTPLPDFITPQVYGVLSDEKVQNSQTGQLIQVPQTDPRIIPAQFGVPWTAQAGFSVQWLLFQPEVFAGILARKEVLNFSDKNITVAEDKAKENVLNAYYLILVTEQQLELINTGVQRLEKLYLDLQQMYRNGFSEKLDVDRTLVARNNIRSTQAQLNNSLALAYASLKLATGLPQADSLVLTDRLTPEVIKQQLPDTKGFNYENRSEIRLLLSAKRLQEYDLKRYQLQKYPTVATFWNYNRSAFRQEFNFFNSGSQFQWFPSSILGVSLQVPIFSGTARLQRVKQAHLKIEQVDNNLLQTKMLIDFQLEQARISYRNAVLELDANEKNMELAESVFNFSKKRFEAGLGTSFEVINAENEWQTAQSNYLRSLYNAVQAQLAWKRATGTL